MTALRAPRDLTFTRPALLPRALFGVAAILIVVFCLAGTAFAAPTTTPALSPVSPDGAAGWYVTTPVLTLNSSEAGVTYYSLDTSTGPWTTYSGPVDIPDGVSTVYFYSSDTSGNDEAVSSLQIRVDTTAPVPSVGGVTDGALYAAPVTPTFSAVDTNLSSVGATLDGSPFSSGALVSAEGLHTLTVGAVDSAGNVGSLVTTFTIDTTPPSITISAVTDGGLYSGPVVPLFSASDANLSVTAATLDSVPFASGTIVSAEGVHTLVVTATDAAGNSATSSATFTIDTTPPTVGASTVPASPDGLSGWFTTAPQVTLSASEPGTIDYSLVSTSGPFAAYSHSLAVPDGTTTLYYRATDAAGNTSAVASLDLNVDTTAPDAPTSVSATSTNYTTAQVVWDAVSDAGSGLAYYRVTQDGAVVATTTSNSYLASTLATGTTYAYKVTAVDVAGNESPPSAVATVTTSADFTPPFTTLSMSPASPDGDNGWYISIPSATLLPDEPAATYYSLVSTSGPWLSYSAPLVLPEGTSTLSYYSRDLLGNTEVVRSQPINVDLTPPSSPVASATADSTTTVVVGWQPASDSGSGIGGYQVIEASSTTVLASVAGTATTATVSGLTPQTTYGFRVEAVDVAGHVSAPSAVVNATTLVPDTAAPVTSASLTPPSPDGDNGWYVSVPQITLDISEPGTIYWSWDTDAPVAYSGPIRGLVGDHTLNYYGVDLAGNVEVPNVLHLLVDNVAPTAPSSLDVTVTGPTTMRLNWDASSDSGSKLSGYNIYGNAGSVIATVDAGTTMYVATVPNGKLRSFYVKAFDVAGNVSSRSNTVNRATHASALTSSTPRTSTINENAPAFGRSVFTYSDLQDAEPKYQGGYAQFDNTSTAQYTTDPHGGYDTASNKCQVCHAVHRAEGAYFLMRADSQPDACLYCHVGSSHASLQVYNSDSSGTSAAVGHSIGYAGPIPDSATSMSLKSVEITAIDADGKAASTMIAVRAVTAENKIFRLTRVHAVNPAGDMEDGYMRVGPSALTCTSCHSVHNATSEVWQPQAFPDNDVQLTNGYKLLLANPSGSVWGPDDMPYDGTRTVSYTRDGMVGYKSYTDFSTTGLVNKANVIRAVETTITASNTGTGKTTWATQPWPSQPGADPAHSTTGVNQFALSVWCADCHNLAIGSSAARGNGFVSNIQFPDTVAASDSSETTTNASDWTQVKRLDIDLTGVQRLRVVTDLSSVGTGTADMAIRLGSADATITHSVDSKTTHFTDDINVAGRSGADTLSLSLKVGTADTAANTQFDVYAGTETTTAVELIADLSQPAHETSMTHSSPFQGADNGPAQCYTCHRGDLTPQPDKPYYREPSASCELCHYGTGSYATDPKRTDGSQSDFPHSAPPDGAFLLGAWTVDAHGSVVATTVGTSPDDIREKVCVRCHIPGKRTHPTVPK